MSPERRPPQTKSGGYRCRRSARPLQRVSNSKLDADNALDPVQHRHQLGDRKDWGRFALGWKENYFLFF